MTWATDVGPEPTAPALDVVVPGIATLLASPTTLTTITADATIATSIAASEKRKRQRLLPPPGALPPGSSPPGALPPGAVPPGSLPAGPPSRPLVPKRSRSSLLGADALTPGVVAPGIAPPTTPGTAPTLDPAEPAPASSVAEPMTKRGGGS